jgi:hypothetical protein
MADSHHTPHVIILFDERTDEVRLMGSAHDRTRDGSLPVEITESSGCVQAQEFHLGISYPCGG